MLKRLNLLIVLAAAAGVGAMVVVMSRGVVKEGIRIQGKEITIYSGDYTLARLAEEVGDPEILSYDPEKRQAVARASLVVHGALRIGDASDKKLGETLLLDTVVCGDLRLEVAEGGTLKLDHATVKTVTQELTAEAACSKGYAVVVDGTLEAADSQLLYMSGSQSSLARGNAEVGFKRVKIVLSDGNSFRAANADGTGLTIEDSTFRSSGHYGAIVDGSGGEPIVFRRCRLRGTMYDLYLTGDQPQVDLIDCTFGRSKIFFQRKGGRVAVRWTLTVKVVEDGSAQPMPGVRVVATSIGKAGADTQEDTTDANGTCTLTLTDYVATPGMPARQDDALVTPHRIEVRSPDGELLAAPLTHEARRPRTLQITASSRPSR